MPSRKQRPAARWSPRAHGGRYRGHRERDRYTGILRDWFDETQDHGGVRVAVESQHCATARARARSTTSSSRRQRVLAGRAGRASPRDGPQIRRAAHACIAQDRAASGQTGVTPTSKPAPPVIAGTKFSQHPELVEAVAPGEERDGEARGCPSGHAEEVLVESARARPRLHPRPAERGPERGTGPKTAPVSSPDPAPMTLTALDRQDPRACHGERPN